MAVFAEGTLRNGHRLREEELPEGLERGPLFPQASDEYFSARQHGVPRGMLGSMLRPRAVDFFVGQGTHRSTFILSDTKTLWLRLVMPTLLRLVALWCCWTGYPAAIASAAVRHCPRVAVRLADVVTGVLPRW